MLSPEHKTSLITLLFKIPSVAQKLSNASELRFYLFPTKVSKLIKRSTNIIFSQFSLSQAIVPLLLLLISYGNLSLRNFVCQLAYPSYYFSSFHGSFLCSVLLTAQDFSIYLFLFSLDPGLLHGLEGFL
jgi:hypothetical protein